METVRKRKVAKKTAKAEDSVAEVIPESPESLVLSTDDVAVSLNETSQPTLNVLKDAPALFSISPTAQELEDFRVKELEWRNKLKCQ